MIVNGKEYITIKEMAERLGKKPNAVKQLLYNANIKPVSREALYELEAFEEIKYAPPPGRPPRTILLNLDEDDPDKLYERVKEIHEHTKNAPFGITYVELELDKFEELSPSDKKRFRDLLNEITEVNEVREKAKRKAMERVVATPSSPTSPKKGKKPNKAPKENLEKTEKEEQSNSGEET